MSNFIEILKTVFLGIVEGITEWLPISSTGHMILVDEFLKLNLRDEFKDIFFVIIQIGAILAVVILFWNKIWPFHTKKAIVKPFFMPKDGKKLGGVARFCNDYIYMDKIILWLKIFVACIPAGVLGIAFDDQLDEMLTGDKRAYVVATTLILYGILFIIIESINKKERFDSVDALTFKTAFFIGLIQALSIIPGTSRSGATILGAVLLGTSRTLAAEFSFFLSIPAMFGGSGIKTLQFFMDGNTVTPYEISILILGSAVAFIVSVFSIKFLVSFLKKHDFKPFGYYRIVLGIIVLAYFALAN